MYPTAGDLMKGEAHTVAPHSSLSELERSFFDAGVSGFPVVESGELVGIVPRSDVVRQLCVERSNEEQLSHYYRDLSGFADHLESIEEVAARVGVRIEGFCVRDVMSRSLVTVRVQDSLAEVARTLVEHHIHRVPVTDAGRLVGVISSLDFVRFFAEERAKLTG